MAYIAITGGTASGKSFAVKLLAELLQCAYYDCDCMIGEIYQSNCSLLFKDLLWIQSAINSDGSIDKKELKNLILIKPKFLADLQKILYPILEQKINFILEGAKQAQISHLIFEVPLLFESGFYRLFDININVNINLEIQMIRAIENRKIPFELYHIFCNNQFSNDKKAQLADINFDNNKEIHHLVEQIKSFCTSNLLI